MPASPMPIADAEWLEADGQGGFAFGTADTIRTRRYHGLLVAAPPARRGASCWSTGSRPGWSSAATASRCPASATSPASSILTGRAGSSRSRSSRGRRWTYGLPDGSELACDGLRRARQRPDHDAVAARPGAGPATLHVRPLLSGRDYHALHHENPAFRFDPHRQRDGVVASGNPIPTCRRSPRMAALIAHDPHLVSPVPVCRGSRAGPRLRGGPGFARRAVLGSGRRGRDAGAGGRIGVPARRVAALAAASKPRRAAIPPTASRGAGASGDLRRPADADRRLSVVHRLGARHVHRPARRAAGDRTARGGARRAAGVGRAGQRGDAAQPVPRRRRRAGVQLGRCVAVVHRRGARPAGRGDACRMPTPIGCARPAPPSWRAMRPARASASGWTRTG